MERGRERIHAGECRSKTVARQGISTPTAGVHLNSSGCSRISRTSAWAISASAADTAAAASASAAAAAASASNASAFGNIGLAAREVFHVSRIDKQHIEPRVLQQVVERLPVVARGLHHRTSDPLSDQMLTQGQDLTRHRAPGGNRLNSFAAPSTSDPNAHLGVPLRDIQARTAGMNHFHGASPFPPEHLRCSSWGGQGNSKI